MSSLPVSKKQSVKLIFALLLVYSIVKDTETTEAIYTKCIKDANKKFASLARIIYNSDRFFGRINNLKCIYLDLVDGILDDAIPCDTERTTYLNLDSENLLKIKDLNKKEAVALKGYTQLLSDVNTSLADIEAFEGNVTSRKFIINMVKNVTKRLTEIRGNMMFVAKAYTSCNQETFNSTIRIIPDRVILPFNEPTLINSGFKREELAGALFKQMQTIFLQIKEEFFYRKGCFS